MAAKYFALLTNLGAAKLANAAALGTKLEITQMAVGDGGGSLPIPDPAMVVLKGEKRRGAINLLAVDPLNANQIIAEQVIPENEGGWWIREIGLFDKDGVLIAIANCPETYKPQLQEGSGRTQTIRVILIVSRTEAVTLKIDPSVVLATRQYVDEKIIEVRTYADRLIEKHIKDKNPHSQYLLIENLLSEVKILGPKSVDLLLTNISLGSAAKRSVGVGENQIPDMSFFSTNGRNWQKLPGGLILQFGSVDVPAGTSGITISLPVAFNTDSKSAIVTSSQAGVFSQSPAMTKTTLTITQSASGVSGVNWFCFGY